MKRVIDNLLYDTDKAMLIGSAHKPFIHYDFYRTVNGRYFCVYSNILGEMFKCNDFYTDKQSVKELMYELIPDVAFKEFGNIKEA